MAMSSRTKRPRKRSPVLLVGIVLVLLGILYTAGWFAAANYATTKLEHAFDGDNPLASALDCPGMRMSGFPLHIGLNCTKVSVNDSRNGITGSSGAFRSSAEIFRPGRIKWEIDGPAILQTSTGLAGAFQWDSFRSTLSLGMNGVDSSASVIQKLQANLTDALSGRVLRIDAAESRTRLQRDGEDLVGTARLTGMDFGQDDRNPDLPPMAAQLDVKLLGQARALDIEHPEPIELRGLSGDIRNLQIDMGQGRTITASGPISIDNAGLANGTLKLEIGKVDAWRDLVIAAYPETKDIARMAAKGLKAVFLGQNQGQVTLQITNGVVVLGFIPLGNIPPI
ncbi:DUF2125 domain-containing protein [Agrobacterium vitis]|nr:DUF2125 domain-containing protein [Allorhizobium ampelinum]MUO90638.1 DUF2125 domain-containing protein [Agrobacterium vitis]MUZ52513.1 DUF2125 domain-containing protein [Agrobacterium vitis]MUZ92300.1 DUF2125 domain-containing protein [Agrobacterium vitis]MVA42704.1 DUF2125 domain-containing protein [Agrobacterium vitis]